MINKQLNFVYFDNTWYDASKYYVNNQNRLCKKVSEKEIEGFVNYLKSQIKKGNFEFDEEGQFSNEKTKLFIKENDREFAKQCILETLKKDTCVGKCIQIKKEGTFREDSPCMVFADKNVKTKWGCGVFVKVYHWNTKPIFVVHDNIKNK